eukprot:759622-Hanusia_phi.AAC.3
MVKLNEEMSSKRLQGAAREEHMLDQVRQAERESSSLRKELEGTKAELESLRMELKKMEAEVGRVRSGNSEEIKTLSVKQEKSLSQIVKLEEELWSKKAELQAFEQRVRLLTEKIVTVGSERDEWKRKFVDMEEKSKNAMIELEASKSEARRTIAEVAKEKDFQISSLEEEIDTLRSEKERMKVLSSRTRQELFQQRERTESLEEEVRRLGELIQEEQEGKKKLSQEIALLVRQLDELRERSSSMMEDESRTRLAREVQEELAKERQARQEAEERLLSALLEREEVVESKEQVKEELAAQRRMVQALDGVGELQLRLAEDIGCVLDSLDLSVHPSWPLQEDEKREELSWSRWNSDQSAAVLELIRRHEGSMLVLSSSLGQADASCEKLAQHARQLRKLLAAQETSSASDRRQEEEAGQVSMGSLDHSNHRGGEQDGADGRGDEEGATSEDRDSHVARFLANGFVLRRGVEEDEELKPVVEILRSKPTRGCMWKGKRKDSKLNFSEGASNSVYLVPKREDEDAGNTAPVSSWRTSLDVEV